jgi:enamine deaminase RidA (YjgF/YER057c/UK114 family)
LGAILTLIFRYETICVAAPMFNASLTLSSSVTRQTVWDKYAPVAHLERLVFASEEKDVCVIAPAPFNGAAVAPPAAHALQLPLPAPVRSAPLKRRDASLYSSIMLSCRGIDADFTLQCNATLAAASQLLDEAGATWRDVSGVVVILADISSFSRFNQCYALHVPRSSPPTRFSVCVSLEQPTLFLVCIQVCGRSCKHMHVESVSFWAPANIGPYSQAQRYVSREQGRCSLLLLSGQIALVPERMVLAGAEGGRHQQLEAECAQVASNLAAVMAANDVTECAPSAAQRRCWCSLLLLLRLVEVTLLCEQVLVMRCSSFCVCHRGRFSRGSCRDLL